MTHLEQNRCPPDEILLKPFYPFLQINAPTRLPEMRSGSAMSQATNECVLLIECQPANARLITSALTNYVHGLFAVESSIKLSDGLERLAKGGVRAVIVDVEMSNGRSVGTIERLLTAAPHVPILILSAMENESVARQAVERAGSLPPRTFMGGGGVASGADSRERIRVAIRIQGFFVQCSRRSDFNRNGPL